MVAQNTEGRKSAAMRIIAEAAKELGEEQFYNCLYWLGFEGYWAYDDMGRVGLQNIPDESLAMLAAGLAWERDTVGLIACAAKGASARAVAVEGVAAAASAQEAPPATNLFS